MAERELLVRIVGDDRALQRTLGNTERSVQRIDTRMQTFGKTATRAFGAAGIALGTSAIFRGADRAVEAASDLNEQITRSNQVFQKNAESVLAWSETLASAFGISQAAGLEFAGTFGLLFKNIGTSTDDAEKFSRQLVELAADLASFNNTDVDTALNALRSGLTGEIEPLRRFGVFLNEARSNQVALTQTGKESSKQLTTQEKVLARLSIIMQDTSRAQGDFARTSDGLANKQRIAAAEAENLAANVGQVLAPAMDLALISTIALVGGINDLIDGMGDLRAAIDESNFAEGFNRAIEDSGNAIVDFGTKVRDQIPGMEQFLSLRNRFAGIGDEAPTGNFGDRFPAPSTVPTVERNKKILEDQAAAERKAGQAAIDRIERQANAQKSFNQQIAESEKRAAHLRDLIRADPDNEKLQKRLSAEYKKQNDLRAEQARLNQQNAEDARREAEAAKRARLEREREAAEARRRQNEARKAAIQARQFAALGLTEEGERPTPGSGSLLARARSLQDRVKGTPLDTDKTRSQLQRIISVLRKNFKTAGKEVRQAILEMLNDISSALEGKGADKSGPLTRTSSLNSKKLLEGIGLSNAEIKELRLRLSNFNSAGVGFAGGGAAAGGISTVRPQGESGRVFVESHTTINLDGQQIANVVTRNQQRAKRRNPKQKRGPNRR